VEPEYQALRDALVAWFDEQQRDLPWRHTTDPYAIWLSEIMLQQTRVETVKPYYRSFLERFPDVQAMASAPLADVLALWSGLGYYRRARNLHAAAQMVCDTFEGTFPSTHETIMSLPGVGRYTAGAIASIAFDLPYAAVDGNVHRVMSRLFCIHEPRSSKELDKQSWKWASMLVEGPRPGDFNQALMELGATICTPRSPTCMLCPIHTHCEAFATGQTENLPLPKVKKAAKELNVLWALLKRKGKVLLIKRPDTGLFAGMWELPGLYLDAEQDDSPDHLQTHVEGIGLQAQFTRAPAHYTHVLTHRRLSIALYQGSRLQGRVNLPRTHWKWIDPSDPPELALSSITSRILDDIAKDNA
jgi:A/G-specific adenine glycosylase